MVIWGLCIGKVRLGPVKAAPVRSYGGFCIGQVRLGQVSSDNYCVPPYRLGLDNKFCLYKNKCSQNLSKSHFFLTKYPFQAPPDFLGDWALDDLWALGLTGQLVTWALRC